MVQTGNQGGTAKVERVCWWQGKGTSNRWWREGKDEGKEEKEGDKKLHGLDSKLVGWLACKEACLGRHNDWRKDSQLTHRFAHKPGPNNPDVMS